MFRLRLTRSNRPFRTKALPNSILDIYSNQNPKCRILIWRRHLTLFTQHSPRREQKKNPAASGTDSSAPAAPSSGNGNPWTRPGNLDPLTSQIRPLAPPAETPPPPQRIKYD